MNHTKALRLLGEISGITLRVNPDGRATVSVNIEGVDFEVIADHHGGDGCIVDHHITRSGLMNILSNGGD